MRTFILILVTFLSLSSFSTGTFKEEQLKFQRVKNAATEKSAYLNQLCLKNGLKLENIEIYMRAFKKEQTLEVWARNRDKGNYVLLKSYDICASSGILGPKLAQGDRQTPEGFYYIDRFNPQSSFYLSLGINFPNKCDKARCALNPGGDIFIHGSCVTIGCIPLTDDYIKEVYLLSVEARNNGQTKIPVHIFPFRMNETNQSLLTGTNQLFWKNLKEGYDRFEKNKIPPSYEMLADGRYQF